MDVSARDLTASDARPLALPSGICAGFAAVCIGRSRFHICSGADDSVAGRHLYNDRTHNFVTTAQNYCVPTWVATVPFVDQDGESCLYPSFRLFVMRGHICGTREGIGAAAKVNRVAIRGAGQEASEKEQAA